MLTPLSLIKGQDDSIRREGVNLMRTRTKLILISALVFLTAYGPVELTRCIVQYNFPLWADVSYLELLTMWGMYFGFVTSLSSIIWRIRPL